MEETPGSTIESQLGSEGEELDVSPGSDWAAEL